MWRRRLGAASRVARESPRAAGADLRAAPGLVAPPRGRTAIQPVVSRAGRDARAVCARHGLYAHRAAAGDGAPLLRLVGLPGGGLLRAVEPLRHARRLPL